MEELKWMPESGLPSLHQGGQRTWFKAHWAKFVSITWTSYSSLSTEITVCGLHHHAQGEMIEEWERRQPDSKTQSWTKKEEHNVYMEKTGGACWEVPGIQTPHRSPHQEGERPRGPKDLGGTVWSNNYWFKHQVRTVASEARQYKS